MAVVTGANRGIGFEVCDQLARAGVRVVLTSRDAVKGQAACKTLSDAGLPVVFHPLDVTSAPSVDALAAYVAQTFGGADILVNNAGVMLDPRGTRFLDSRVDTYRATLETNVLGPLRVTQAAISATANRSRGNRTRPACGLLERGHAPALRVTIDRNRLNWL